MAMGKYLMVDFCGDDDPWDTELYFGLQLREKEEHWSNIK
jgi:hypothetical protein